jgi:DNA-binding response OmpR family regulator
MVLEFRAMEQEGEFVPRILMIEDDLTICQMFCQFLKQSNILAEYVCEGHAALRKLGENLYDLVLLDLMLPHVSGFEILKKIRMTSNVPVILLTALATEKDRVKGFEFGADDYVTKPFYPKELRLRIQNLLKRSGNSGLKNQDELKIGPVIVRLKQKEILIQNSPIELTDLEFDLLCVLIKNQGSILSRKVLARETLGNDLHAQNRKIDVHISNIRRKLGPWESMIRTVRGLGYEFVPELLAC